MASLTESLSVSIDFTDVTLLNLLLNNVGFKLKMSLSILI